MLFLALVVEQRYDERTRDDLARIVCSGTVLCLFVGEFLSLHVVATGAGDRADGTLVTIALLLGGTATAVPGLCRPLAGGDDPGLALA